MTQGDPMSPTIFNVVVDAVIRHWVHGIMEEAEAQGETGREGRHQPTLFYANDGMVTLSDPAWLQGAFTALVGCWENTGGIQKEAPPSSAPKNGAPPSSAPQNQTSTSTWNPTRYT